MLKPMVEVRDENGTLVAEFWDCLRLDPAPVRDLRVHLETHLKTPGRPDLVVDLNGVTYAGSAALGGFIGIHRLISPRGGRVIFCNVDENVLEVFRVSKLLPLFTFAANRAAALALPAGPALKLAPSSTTQPRTSGPLSRKRSSKPES